MKITEEVVPNAGVALEKFIKTELNLSRSLRVTTMNEARSDHNRNSTLAVRERIAT